MQRRTFLSTAAVAATATALRGAASGNPGSGEFIDTNVYLSHWAVRHSWAKTPAALVAKLRGHGVTSAWVGSFEGVLHTDIAGVNARLAESCSAEGGGLLVPFGTINPTLPDWEDDLRRCHEVHRMPGVRLFPNYHGYTLEDARFVRLLELAAKRGLLVQVSLLLEDERSQNPVLKAPPVQAAGLVDALARAPGARAMLLNAGSRVIVGNAPLLQRLAAAGVWVDTANIEGVAGIGEVLKSGAGVRLTFGSHSPYFYFEAALLKLQESVLSAAELAAIRHGHARSALKLA